VNRPSADFQDGALRSRRFVPNRAARRGSSTPAMRTAVVDRDGFARGGP